MQENKEMNSKLIGVGIVVVAILLMVLAICTNFFSDISGFEKPAESGEVLQPDQKDESVGYSTGFVPMTGFGEFSGEIKASGEIIRTPRQREAASGD